MTFFLFFTACKKGDIICIGCPKPPACLATSFSERDEFGHPRPVIHFEMGIANNRPAWIQPTYVPPTGAQPWRVVYAVNNLYIIGSTDTVIQAKLDPCMRPVSSLYKDAAFNIRLSSKYSYNYKGQLTKIVVTGTTNEVYNYKYDNRGNVTSIIGERNNVKYLFRYDYAQPFTKGVRYAYSINYGPGNLMPHFYFEWLGHLNLTPANLRSSAELSINNTLIYARSYDQYGFQGGNVSSYVGHDLAPNSFQRFFYTIEWQCKAAVQ